MRDLVKTGYLSKHGERDLAIVTFSWAVKCLIIVGLCVIHDYTKNGMCRTVSDLFYWPEGLCPDSVAVVLFFVVGTCTIIDSARMVRLIKIETKRGKLR